MEDLYRLLWGLGNMWRRGRKSSELEGGEMCHKRCLLHMAQLRCLWTWCHRDSLTRLRQDWACQYFIWKREEFMVSPLPEGLLTANGFWGRGCHFSPRGSYWSSVHASEVTFLQCSQVTEGVTDPKMTWKWDPCWEEGSQWERMGVYNE